MTISDSTPSPLQVSANSTECLFYYGLKHNEIFGKEFLPFCRTQPLFKEKPHYCLKHNEIINIRQKVCRTQLLKKTARTFYLKLGMWLVLLVLHHLCKFQPILWSVFFTMALNTMKYWVKKCMPFCSFNHYNSHYWGHILIGFKSEK